ncbi:MAG: polyphenol oxidase family protein [Thermoanaerobaculia bacterium]
MDHGANAGISTGGRDRSGIAYRADRAADVEVRFFGKGVAGRDAELPVALVPLGLERAWLTQIHSAIVHEARPGLVGEGDALVSGARRLGLVVATADCVPLLIAGASRLAAVHAGWRGVAARIVERALERLAEPARVAWIGPAIGGCCYEVGEEVAAAVVAASDRSVLHPGSRGRPHLDLASAVAAQLARAGVGEIRRASLCTRCSGDFWSHRRDGSAARRNLALIWRRGPELA